ncbi:MAG TPA: hypothetical protein ENH29_07890 [Bacteroidetes bacterium]|nr:hypothetical protein [Bacteroidota bacterium]
MKYGVIKKYKESTPVNQHLIFFTEKPGCCADRIKDNDGYETISFGSRKTSGTWQNEINKLSLESEEIRNEEKVALVIFVYRCFGYHLFCCVQ